MFDLTPVRENGLRLMDEFGRDHLGRSLQELGWRLQFDGAKRRLGLCKWKRRGRIVRILSLSRHFARQHGWDVMEDVVRHEIAHAIDYERRGKSLHDRTWEMLAEKVGADPTRILDSAELDDPESKYVGICPSCAAEHPFYRRVKRVHACPDCCRRHNGGQFSMRYRLLIVERESGRVIQRAA
ncbi:MAG: SprT-like domain-containing protein [Rhodothermales bacterium]